MVTQRPNGGLKPVEQSLAEHVVCGEPLDLAGDQAVDEAAMRSWDDSRSCRAFVIRDILRGRLGANPDPHGLRLRGARIIGRLDLGNVITDVNLELRDCLLEEGVLARDARLASVTLTGCQIEHPAESALDGARLTCSLLDLNEARVISHASTGAVNVSGAHIGDKLDCTGAELRNDSGPALVADALQVDQAVNLRGGFTATGNSDNTGAVNLAGAHIGGDLNCIGAELRNDSGPALVADALRVDRSLFLTGSFIAVGSHPFGAVRFPTAHIGGQFNCDGDLRNDSGPALLAFGLEVGQAMFLVGFSAIGGGDGAAIDLTSARVGGAFWFAPMRLDHKADLHRLLAMDGLAYAGVPKRISGQDWREMLRRGTPYYATQPYQQLAAGYRALGDERQVRETLIAQRNDQLARTHPGRWERLWGWITKVTLGYGYKPWRALWFLAGVVVVSCLLACLLGAHGALTQTSKTATPGKPCTVVQQVSVGLDLNLPVGTSLARAGCDLTTHSVSATAAWLSGVGWVLRILAWAFAALFIAGFTSAVRKT